LNRRRRLAQVAAVLSRHGAGYLLVRFGLADLLPLHKERLGRAARDEANTRPDHLRLALEELGTTAIKLGQILSTRADLLPPAYVDELAKLRDRVPPKPAAAIRQVIEREFGRPVDEVFARFDDEPLASASIGQVHAARLFTGEEVVVKVQKPGVADRSRSTYVCLTGAAEGDRRWVGVRRCRDRHCGFAWTCAGSRLRAGSDVTPRFGVNSPATRTSASTDLLAADRPAGADNAASVRGDDRRPGGPDASVSIVTRRRAQRGLIFPGFEHGNTPTRAGKSWCGRRSQGPDFRDGGHIENDASSTYSSC
jgi:hypothetical protein